MSEKERDSAASQRIAFLNQETISDWTRRFMRERGMPEPTNEELARILEDGKADERAAHQ